MGRRARFDASTLVETANITISVDKSSDSRSDNTAGHDIAGLGAMKLCKIPVSPRRHIPSCARKRREILSGAATHSPFPASSSIESRYWARERLSPHLLYVLEPLVFFSSRFIHIAFPGS